MATGILFEQICGAGNRMILLLILFLFECVVCFILRNIGLMVIVESDSAQIVMLMINLFIGTYALLHENSNEQPGVQNALTIGFALRIFMILWDIYATRIFILPNSHLDTESFQRTAVLYMQQGGDVNAYSVFLGTLYRIIGVQRLTAEYVNLLLCYISIYLFRYMLKDFDVSEKVRDRALIAAALLPNYMIVSVILLRECLISTLLTASLVCFVRWWKRGGAHFFILSILLTVLAGQYHSGSLSAGGGYALLFVLTKRGEAEERIFHISFSALVKAAAVVAVFIYAYSTMQDKLFGRIYVTDLSQLDNYFNEHRSFSVIESSDSSHYSAGVAGLSGFTNIIVNTPIRLVSYLLAPAPWDWRGFTDVFAFFFSSALYIYAVWVGARSLRRQFANRDMMVALIILCACSALTFAWGVESAGSALRHRIKIVYFFFLLYALTGEGENSNYKVCNGVSW
ncbi:hypothetical protein AGMMS49992_28380 [Clostridia bacterium]|nr:hypothetical protein AGMMS49992_28380 [Clostridia bacterium]